MTGELFGDSGRFCFQFFTSSFLKVLLKYLVMFESFLKS